MLALVPGAQLRLSGRAQPNVKSAFFRARGAIQHLGTLSFSVGRVQCVRFRTHWNVPARCDPSRPAKQAAVFRRFEWKQRSAEQRSGTATNREPNRLRTRTNHKRTKPLKPIPTGSRESKRTQPNHENPDMCKVSESFRDDKVPEPKSRSGTTRADFRAGELLASEQ